jgi:hypothetical protein
VRLPSVGDGLTEIGIDKALDDALGFEVGEGIGERAEVLGEEGWGGGALSGGCIGCFRARSKGGRSGMICAVDEGGEPEVRSALGEVIEDGDRDCGKGGASWRIGGEIVQEIGEQ